MQYKELEAKINYCGERGPKGPQGEQGPEGPQGPQGEQGIPGPTDLSNYSQNPINLTANGDDEIGDGSITLTSTAFGGNNYATLGLNGSGVTLNSTSEDETGSSEIVLTPTQIKLTLEGMDTGQLPLTFGYEGVTYKYLDSFDSGNVDTIEARRGFVTSRVGNGLDTALNSVVANSTPPQSAYTEDEASYFPVGMVWIDQSKDTAYVLLKRTLYTDPDIGEEYWILKWVKIEEEDDEWVQLYNSTPSGSSTIFELQNGQYYKNIFVQVKVPAGSSWTTYPSIYMYHKYGSNMSEVAQATFDTSSTASSSDRWTAMLTKADGNARITQNVLTYNTASAYANLRVNPYSDSIPGKQWFRIIDSKLRNNINRFSMQNLAGFEVKIYGQGLVYPHN